MDSGLLASLGPGMTVTGLLTVVTVSVTSDSESNLAHKDASGRHSRASGRGRCPRAELRSAPGRSGHHACRHYDRSAGCIAASGCGAGGVKPAAWTLAPTKPGPGRALGMRYSPWQEPWWNAGRRARPTADGSAQADLSVARPHPLVRD